MNRKNPESLAFSVEDFCKAHGISRAMYYVLKKQGKAPRSFRVGNKPLISTEAAAEWRRQMESMESEAAA
jgi:phage terminase small subunit